MDDSDGWITSKKRRGRKSTEPSAAEPEQQQRVDYWSPGELVIVLMRGVPGSGKSTHAAKIAAAAQAVAQKPPNAAPVAAVLSSDDFFIHAGRYCFEVDRLTEAHEVRLLKIEKGVRGKREREGERAFSACLVCPDVVVVEQETMS